MSIVLSDYVKELCKLQYMHTNNLYRYGCSVYNLNTIDKCNLHWLCDNPHQSKTKIFFHNERYGLEGKGIKFSKIKSFEHGLKILAGMGYAPLLPNLASYQDYKYFEEYLANDKFINWGEKSKQGLRESDIERVLYKNLLNILQGFDPKTYFDDIVKTHLIKIVENKILKENKVSIVKDCPLVKKGQFSADDIKWLGYERALGSKRPLGKHWHHTNSSKNKKRCHKIERKTAKSEILKTDYLAEIADDNKQLYVDINLWDDNSYTDYGLDQEAMDDFWDDLIIEQHYKQMREILNAKVNSQIIDTYQEELSPKNVYDNHTITLEQPKRGKKIKKTTMQKFIKNLKFNFTDGGMIAAVFTALSLGTVNFMVTNNFLTLITSGIYLVIFVITTVLGCLFLALKDDK